MFIERALYDELDSTTQSDDIQKHSEDQSEVVKVNKRVVYY